MKRPAPSCAGSRQGRVKACREWMATNLGQHGRRLVHVLEGCIHVEVRMLGSLHAQHEHPLLRVGTLVRQVGFHAAQVGLGCRRHVERVDLLPILVVAPAGAAGLVLEEGGVKVVVGVADERVALWGDGFVGAVPVLDGARGDCVARLPVFFFGSNNKKWDGGDASCYSRECTCLYSTGQDVVRT